MNCDKLVKDKTD